MNCTAELPKYCVEVEEKLGCVIEEAQSQITQKTEENSILLPSLEYRNIVKSLGFFFKKKLISKILFLSIFKGDPVDVLRYLFPNYNLHQKPTGSTDQGFFIQ